MISLSLFLGFFISILLIQYLAIIVIIFEDKGEDKCNKEIKSKKQLYRCLIPFYWVYFGIIFSINYFIASLKELEDE